MTPQASATLILIAAILAGCASPVGQTGVVLGNLKMPTQLRVREFSPLNKPLRPEDAEAIDKASAEERRLAPKDPKKPSFFRWGQRKREVLDDFAEFRGSDGRDSLVLIAVSGGGARAALLAGHTMRLIEKRYNELRDPNQRVLIEVVDAFSTVSGGSLYAYHVGRHGAAKNPIRGAGCPKGEQQRQHFFCNVAADRRTRLGTEQLGVLAFQSVIGVYGIGLLQSLFTDKSYADHLAQGLEVSRNWWSPLVPLLVRELKFNDIPDRPRLYFNATALEASSPFVFTQRVTNLPPHVVPPRTARPHLRDRANKRSSDRVDDRRPLQSSLTLEGIGSSPGRFAVATAAAASAAFPFGVEPVKLRVYSHRPSDYSPYATHGLVSLSDGGVYDNSGLTTAVDLYEHLTQFSNVRHLVLISINADASQYDTEVADRSYRKGRSFPAGLSSPAPSVLGAADSINAIHYLNKRRSEDEAWRRLMAIDAELRAEVETAGDASNDFLKKYEQYLSQQSMRGPREREYEYVHYFPISLAQLSPLDPHRVESSTSHFEAVRDIPTGYWARPGDSEALERAAAKILRAKQTSSWKVGPECGRKIRGETDRLQDAIAFSLIRAGGPRWGEELDGPGVKPWCDAHGGKRRFKRRS